MKRVLINAANLHVGGGVQVAVSFIAALPALSSEERFRDLRLEIWASSVVDRNLCEMGFDPDQLHSYRVVAPRKPWYARLVGLLDRNEFDSVFTVFGPDYAFRTSRHAVIGFAQPWIVNPLGEHWRMLGFWKRLRWKIKFELQWFFFLRASHLIVELPHVRNALWAKRGYPVERIDVVPNCLSPVFFEPVRWREASAWPGKPSNEVWLGYLTRDYPHKNLEFLVALAGELRKKSSLRYRFFVTLTASEWAARSVGFRATVDNVGPLSLAQCPSFYRAMDGVVFPSLLECFSATPLEAMFMERPLFASDRGFVRDCCADNARYFEPTDPADAAAAIIDWYENTAAEERQARVDAARRHVLAMPDSRDRARRYMEIILRELGLPAPT